MTQSYSYTYDNLSNVLTETQPNGQTITYTYDMDQNNYNMPLTTSYKQDATTTVLTTNTLTADRKNIAEQTTRVNGTVKEKSEYAYDTSGRLITQKTYIDAANYITTQYVYGAAAQPVEIKVIGVKDAGSYSVTASPGYAAGTIVTKVTYNDRGLPISQTDPKGNVTTITYDAVGRVTGTTNPDGTTAEYAYALTTDSYSEYGAFITYTNELGTEIQSVYSRHGGLAEVYDVASGVLLSAKTYDQNHRVIAETVCSSDGEDRTTFYHYDNYNRLLEAVTENSAGAVTSKETYGYTYSNNQYVTTQTKHGDANAPSIVTTTYVDNMGNTVKTGRQLDSTMYYDTYTYDYVGNLLTEKTAYTTSISGIVTNTYTYDHTGAVLTAKNAQNQIASAIYDWAGRLTAETDYAGSTTTYTYDALGRLIQQAIPFAQSGSTVYYANARYYYDQNGNLRSEEVDSQVPGSQNVSCKRTEYEYDERNRPTLVKQYPDSTSTASVNTQYAYDGAGNVLCMYTGLSSETAYEYDRFSRLVLMTDPLGQTESYTYDLNGNLLTKTDRNGVETEYAYDNLGRVVSTTAGAEYVTVTYTLTGQVRSEANATSTSVYTYDSLGRLIGEVTAAASKTYGYNLADNRTSFTLTAANAQQFNTSYTYDALCRLIGTNENGVTTTYGYDTNGNRSYVQYGNGLREEYTYNLANLVTGVTNKKDTTTLSSYAYTYYTDGNQRTKTDHSGKVTTYTYDGLGRLTCESESGGSTTQTYTYTYDGNSNRSSLTAAGAEAYVTTYVYDANNRLLTETKTTSDRVDQKTYHYDPNGNQVGVTQELYSAGALSEALNISLGVASGEIYRYNEFNQLVQTYNEAGMVSYAYNAAGLRVSKTVDGVETVFVLDGGNVALELESGTVTAKYLWAMNLVCAVRGVNTRYYLYNGHGDVVQLTDTSGTVTRNYDYDAFGVETDPDEDDTNPFRYCGEYYDTETGRYYLRARYYDPGAGRFAQQDDWEYADPNDPLSLNLYTYCKNNPLRFVDPSGHNEVVVYIPLEALGLEWIGEALAAAGGLFILIGGAVYVNILVALDILEHPENYADVRANPNAVAGRSGGPSSEAKTSSNPRSHSYVESSATSPSSPDPDKKPSLKRLDNKQAEKVAQENGYKDAHDLKNDYVSKNQISQYDIKIDNNTGEIYLEGIQNGAQIATGLFS